MIARLVRCRDVLRSYGRLRALGSLVTLALIAAPGFVLACAPPTPSAVQGYEHTSDEEAESEDEEEEDNDVEGEDDGPRHDDDEAAGDEVGGEEEPPPDPGCVERCEQTLAPKCGADEDFCPQLCVGGVPDAALSCLDAAECTKEGWQPCLEDDAAAF